MKAGAPSSVPAVVADRASRSGIGPLWHAREKRLYWLDAHVGSLLFFDPAAGKSGRVRVGEKIQQFLIGDDGSLLLFTEKGALKAMQGEALTILVDGLPWRSGTVDAAAVDPDGRLYIASRAAGSRSCALYRVEPGGEAAKVLEDAGRVSGLVFDASAGQVCCCDAVSREVLLLTPDPLTGSLSHRKVIVRIPESLGVPHGVAVDAKGFLWIALWGGSCVMRISPAGREERRAYFTARLVSGLAFGGEDLRDLYVTTSGAEDRKTNGPGAGALYRLRSGVKGIPGALVRGWPTPG